jgi:DNA-binding SARP family transcriptional activator
MVGMSVTELNRVDQLPASGVRYRLLQPVELSGESGRLCLGGPKQRTVLAALLLSANRVVSEEKLFTLVWGEELPVSVRGRMHVYISELRKLLGTGAILRRPPGYLIQVAPGELDLDVFAGAVARAKAELSAGRPERGVELLREALALWRDPVLGGVTESLAEQVGPVLRDGMVAVLEDMFDAELGLGRHLRLINELREAAGRHPLRERLQAQLMLALHRSGRTAEALEVYAHARDNLVSELGIEPGTLLREVRSRIRRKAEAAPAERVTVRPRRPAPAELPRDVRCFAGRREELRGLDADLAADSPVIWVIRGTAGVGKTALAVHWGVSVRERFPDGQLYVDLRGFDIEHEPLTPAAALGHLLWALGADPSRIPPGVDERAGLYRSMMAGRRILLVLDNARDAEQVHPLLPPAGTTLITSRQRLGDVVARSGARELPLDVLSPRDARTLFEDALGPERVTAEPEAAADLARLCGYLPLALRVAAGRIRGEARPSIADLNNDLACGPLSGLTVDGAEEGAVTKALAVSYHALAPGARRLFRLLSLLPGPDFTSGTVAAVAGMPLPAAVRGLRGLAAAHLIECLAVDRYRFHGLLRFYACDRARSEETKAELAQAWTRLIAFHESSGE